MNPEGLVVVPDADKATIIAWFSEARCVDDNDDLAGPGCSFVDMFIYLRSGDRIAILDRSDGILRVGRNNKHYFIEHRQLDDYIKRHQTPGGC